MLRGAVQRITVCASGWPRSSRTTAVPAPERSGGPRRRARACPRRATSCRRRPPTRRRPHRPPAHPPTRRASRLDRQGARTSTPQRGPCLRCMRTCREIRNRPSDRAPERTSPCRITYTRGRAPFSGPRVARRNLRMCFRLIRAVSTRLAHQSCIDLAFCVCPTVLAPPGLAMRARRERWSDQIESRERGAVPAG